MLRWISHPAMGTLACSSGLGKEQCLCSFQSWQTQIAIVHWQDKEFYQFLLSSLHIYIVALLFASLRLHWIQGLALWGCCCWSCCSWFDSWKVTPLSPPTRWTNTSKSGRLPKMAAYTTVCAVMCCQFGLCASFLRFRFVTLYRGEIPETSFMTVHWAWILPGKKL